MWLINYIENTFRRNVESNDSAVKAELFENTKQSRVVSDVISQRDVI